MTYGTGAWIATTAGAAAKRRQMLLAEEEEMTQYTQDDLTNDWEFKIVRSESAAFRKSEALNKLVEEEARAGWVMLEKLDDRRVRFKRPRSARAKDAYLPEASIPTARSMALPPPDMQCWWERWSRVGWSSRLAYLVPRGQVVATRPSRGSQSPRRSPRSSSCWAL